MRSKSIRYLGWLAVSSLFISALLLTTTGRAAKQRLLSASTSTDNSSSQQRLDQSGQQIAYATEADAARQQAAASLPAQQQAGNPAFTLVLTRTVAEEGQPPRLLQTTTRQQRADGVYRLEQTYFGLDQKQSRADVYFGISGYGSFRRDDARRVLVFTGPQVEQQVQDVALYLRQHPHFVREENVAGQLTIVWRDGAEGAQRYREEYRAPALGGLLIKSVTVSGTRRETTEPTSLEMVEPSPALFAELSLLRVDYASYGRQIAEMEHTNRHDEAQIMRQLLSRVRSFKP